MLAIFQEIHINLKRYLDLNSNIYICLLILLLNKSLSRKKHSPNSGYYFNCFNQLRSLTVHTA